MKKSIMTEDMEKCYLCGSRYCLETHHIFGASNRQKSEKYSLIVRLCRRCHNESPTGVHYDYAVSRELKREAQRKAMEVYKWTESDFIALFGRSYF